MRFIQSVFFIITIRLIRIIHPNSLETSKDQSIRVLYEPGFESSLRFILSG